MSNIILSAVTVSLLVTSAATAAPWNRDRIEDRLDQYEDRIDSRRTFGKRDLAEDRLDRFENRLDRNNVGKKCATAGDVDCRGEIKAWWQDQRTATDEDTVEIIE